MRQTTKDDSAPAVGRRRIEITYTMMETTHRATTAQGWHSLFEHEQKALLAEVERKAGDGTFMPLPVTNGYHCDFTAGGRTYRYTQVNGGLVVRRMS